MRAHGARSRVNSDFQLHEAAGMSMLFAVTSSVSAMQKVPIYPIKEQHQRKGKQLVKYRQLNGKYHTRPVQVLLDLSCNCLNLAGPTPSLS